MAEQGSNGAFEPENLDSPFGQENWTIQSENANMGYEYEYPGVHRLETEAPEDHLHTGDFAEGSGGNGSKGNRRDHGKGKQTVSVMDTIQTQQPSDWQRDSETILFGSQPPSSGISPDRIGESSRRTAEGAPFSQIDNPLRSSHHRIPSQNSAIHNIIPSRPPRSASYASSNGSRSRASYAFAANSPSAGDRLSKAPRDSSMHSRSSSSGSERSGHSVPASSRTSHHPDFVLPRWQPDAEVVTCPICGSWFNWLNRKHHCRKCGRVVCSSCSPHRITIPYQYIVQPPPGNLAQSHRPAYNRFTDPNGEGHTGGSLRFGGGERVRLCNPCVPDPNPAPPQIDQTIRFDEDQYRSQRYNRSALGSAITSPVLEPSSSPRHTSSFEPESDQVSIHEILQGFPRRPHQASHSWRNSSSNESARRANQALHNWHLQDVQNARSRSATVNVTARDSHVTDLRNLFRSNHNMQSPNTQRPLPAPPRPPRRPINEDDLCPVCHTELPSSSLHDGEELRANHINNCITTRMSNLHVGSPQPSPIPNLTGSSAPSASSMVLQSTTSAPDVRPAGGYSHSTSMMSTSPAPGPSRPQQRSGVLSFIASEKDCLGDAECQICLEEYEVGQPMGRLECFCKFHLHCIRAWFHQGQGKNEGSCPVHGGRIGDE